MVVLADELIKPNAISVSIDTLLRHGVGRFEVYMKTCCRCKELKKITGFSLDRSREDGVSVLCKSCNNKYYELNKESIKKRTAKYRRANPEACEIWSRKAIDKHPEKHRARNICGRAIKNGVLVKEHCMVCGSNKNIHAHHEDYTKPLSVWWLCKQHHKDRHACLEAWEKING